MRSWTSRGPDGPLPEGHRVSSAELFSLHHIRSCAADASGRSPAIPSRALRTQRSPTGSLSQGPELRLSSTPSS
eukprot:6521145-Pyramimonas_sp.AAC.1